MCQFEKQTLGLPGPAPWHGDGVGGEEESAALPLHLSKLVGITGKCCPLEETWGGGDSAWKAVSSYVFHYEGQINTDRKLRDKSQTKYRLTVALAISNGTTCSLRYIFFVPFLESLSGNLKPGSSQLFLAAWPRHHYARVFPGEIRKSKQTQGLLCTHPQRSHPGTQTHPLAPALCL